MSGLIKRARAAAVIPRAVHEGRARAAALLAEAEREAERVIGRAREARDAIQAEAEQGGRGEGLAAAAAELARVAGVRRARLEALEPELARTALEVARAILGDVVSAGPDAALALARRALEGARARREVVLRVSPRDAPALRAQGGALGSLLQRCPALAVREDAALAPGDVVVETEGGRIDARIETQLAALARAMDEGDPCAMG